MNLKYLCAFKVYIQNGGLCVFCIPKSRASRPLCWVLWLTPPDSDSFKTCSLIKGYWAPWRIASLQSPRFPSSLAFRQAAGTVSSRGAGSEGFIDPNTTRSHVPPMPWHKQTRTKLKVIWRVFGPCFGWGLHEGGIILGSMKHCGEVW